MSQEMKSQSGDALRRDAAEPQSGQQPETQTAEQRETAAPRPPERKRYYPKH